MFRKSFSKEFKDSAVRLMVINGMRGSGIAKAA